MERRRRDGGVVDRVAHDRAGVAARPGRRRGCPSDRCRAARCGTRSIRRTSRRARRCPPRAPRSPRGRRRRALGRRSRRTQPAARSRALPSRGRRWRARRSRPRSAARSPAARPRPGSGSRAGAPAWRGRRPCARGRRTLAPRRADRREGTRSGEAAGAIRQLYAGRARAMFRSRRAGNVHGMSISSLLTRCPGCESALIQIEMLHVWRREHDRRAGAAPNAATPTSSISRAPSRSSSASATPTERGRARAGRSPRACRRALDLRPPLRSPRAPRRRGLPRGCAPR